MTLYIPHSIFHLARLLYVKPETFGPYYVQPRSSYTRLHETCRESKNSGTKIICTNLCILLVHSHIPASLSSFHYSGVFLCSLSLCNLYTVLNGRDQI